MIDINKLTVGEAKEIAKLFQATLSEQVNVAELGVYQPPIHPMVGKHCIVRTYSAGVHIGTVEQVSATEVLLSSSRRLWSWKGAFTLSEAALHGVKEGSRLAETVPEVYLTQAVELIPTTEEARKSYDAFK